MARGPMTSRPPLVLAATVLAAMLVTANVSVLNVALPVLLPDLGATQSEGQWMVDVYAVVLATLLLPVGAIGDRFGRRLILLIGLAVMIVANLATIALDSPLHVIIARGVSGAGAAFVFPATLSTITSTLPDSMRARGIALWTAAVSIGGFLGIIGSGVLIENFWWGSLFLAMAIASVAVFVICALTVPDSSDPAEANLDPPGAILSAVAIGGLVLGIIEGPVKGWTAPLTLGGLLVGAAALLAFVGWELRASRPLLDVRLFANRGTRAGSLSIFTQFVGAFGIFFLVVFYLGLVLGYGPLDTGLALIPISLGLLPASIIAIPLAARFGRRAVGATGLLIMAAGFAYGTTIGVDSGLRHFLISLITMGVGYGLAGPPATEAIVESLPTAKQGVASALNDVLRELGAAIGIAIAGAAFNAAYRSSVSDLDGYPEPIVEAVRESPFALGAVAADLGELAPLLTADVQQATIDGWGQGLWILVIAMLVGAAGFATWAPGRPRALAGSGAHAAGPGDTPPPRPVEHATVGIPIDAAEQPAPAPPVVGPSTVDPVVAPAASPAAAIDATAPEPADPADRPEPSGAPGSPPGLLGPMELAAAAEQEFDRLRAVLDGFDQCAQLLEARAKVPPEMSTWPATTQVEVAERAAIAMEPSLRDLVERAAIVHASAASCVALTGDARAELVRIGRRPEVLGEMQRRGVEAAARLAALTTRMSGLRTRFAGLAELFSTLRPAAELVAEAERTVASAQGLAPEWHRVDLAIDPLAEPHVDAPG